MKLKTKLLIEKFFTEQLWQLLIVIAFLFICSFIFNRYIECIFFCVSHTIIRNAFKKQFHCGTTAMCLSFTLGIGWIGITTMLPLEISLLSSVPVCFIIAGLGFIAQDRLDLIILNAKLKKELEKESEFNVATCTKEQLISRCEELHFSKDKIELAIAFFIDKTKQSELARKFCIEEKSIQQNKRRLRQKLNKK